MRLQTRSPILVFLFSTVGWASTDDGISSCCTRASKRFPSLVDSSTRNDFKTPSFYNARQADIIPSCIFTPFNTRHVSEVVKILTEGQCSFAVRSGGGMVWPGSSNVEGGVLVDLARLREIQVDAGKGVVGLGPALTWGEVYKTLVPLGVHVAGARMPMVGVGGFLMHGGISLLTYEHGFASETVFNYEVVLADGSIISANASSNPDLFWALKFGSTNYGIVTRFDMKTFPLPDRFWGGVILYNEPIEFVQQDLLSHWLRAIDSYDVKTFSMLSFDRELRTSGIIQSHLLGTPISPLILPNIASPMINTTKETTIYEFVDFLTFVVGSTPKRVSWYSINVLPHAKFLYDFKTRAYEICDTLEHLEGFQCIILMQPLTRRMIEANGMYDANGDLINILLELHWSLSEGDQAIDEAVEEMRGWAEEESQELDIDTPFLDANYASGSQNFYQGSIGKRMVKVKKKYDPENVFGRLWKGGFKLADIGEDSGIEHVRDEL